MIHADFIPKNGTKSAVYRLNRKVGGPEPENILYAFTAATFLEFFSRRTKVSIKTRSTPASLSYMDQTPVVQMMDSAIHRISNSETNCNIQRIMIYPVDSVIHLLNNWGLQVTKYTSVKWTIVEQRGLEGISDANP